MVAYKVKEVVSLKKGQLGNYAVILEGIPARGSFSRLRSKFVKQLNEIVTEANEEIKESLKEHAEYDDDGNLVVTEQGAPSYKSVEDMEEHMAVANDIHNEEVFFEGMANKKLLEAVAAILETSSVEYSGAEATIYDMLCDALLEETEE